MIMDILLAIAFNYLFFKYVSYLIKMYFEGKYQELDLEEADLSNVDDLIIEGKQIDSFLLNFYLEIKKIVG